MSKTDSWADLETWLEQQSDMGLTDADHLIQAFEKFSHRPANKFEVNAIRRAVHNAYRKSISKS